MLFGVVVFGGYCMFAFMRAVEMNIDICVVVHMWSFVLGNFAWV